VTIESGTASFIIWIVRSRCSGIGLKSDRFLRRLDFPFGVNLIAPAARRPKEPADPNSPFCTLSALRSTVDLEKTFRSSEQSSLFPTYVVAMIRPMTIGRRASLRWKPIGLGCKLQRMQPLNDAFVTVSIQTAGAAGGNMPAEKLERLRH